MSDHVATLKRARERLVAQRRAVAASVVESPITSQVEEFTALQAAIEAMDGAIEDELEEAHQARQANEPDPDAYAPIQDEFGK